MSKNPERLFPFANRARLLVVGRDNLARLRKKLQFIIITTDISENSRREIESDYPACPIIQKYTSDQMNTFFGFKNCKVVGFRKSDLSLSLLKELKT